MAFFQKRVNEMESFGPALRALRELRDLTLEQAGELTKIHPTIIHALEEERLFDLKDPLYAERHIRCLIKALEGQTAYFIKKYRLLLEERVPTSQPVKILPSFKRKGEFIVTSRIVAATFFCLCVVVLGGYVIWQARSLQGAPSLTVSEPIEGVRLSSPHVEVRGTAPAAVAVAVNGRSAIVDSEGVFFVTLEVPRGLTTLTIEARRRYGASASETRRVTYEPVSAVMGTSTEHTAFIETDG